MNSQSGLYGNDHFLRGSKRYCANVLLQYSTIEVDAVIVLF